MAVEHSLECNADNVIVRKTLVTDVAVEIEKF